MMKMSKSASAAAVSAAVAAAAVCGALAACPAAMANTAAPSQPTQTTVYAADYFEATVSWKKVAGADRFQVRLAESKDALPSAKAQDVEATDHEGYIVRQHATVSGLSAGTEYFFQVRAGKSYTEKAKVGKKAYKAAKAAGEKTSTKAVRQYKAKKKSGKWTKWRAAKPSGYKKSSKRYKTRTVTRYYVKTAKCAWSPWGQDAESAASIETKSLPAANATENGRAQSELVVPEGGVAVSYVGLSKPWTGSGSEVTVLRLDVSEGLWEPADEAKDEDANGLDRDEYYDTGEYCFKGWYFDEALTKPCADAKAAEAGAVGSEVTLYAKWTGHDYQQRRIFRYTYFNCGWMNPMLPLAEIDGQNKNFFAKDYWNNVDNYVNMTPSLSSLGKGNCELVWDGSWGRSTGLTYDYSNPEYDWSDGDIALRYDSAACEWVPVDCNFTNGCYYGKLRGRTHNLACWFPMKYEVCSDCNHVGERLTDLPLDTEIRADGALEGDEVKASHEVLTGNVEALYTQSDGTETVSTQKSNPFKDAYRKYVAGELGFTPTIYLVDSINANWRDYL